MANNLGGTIINADQDINENEYNNAKIISNKHFSSYKENYIKKAGTPEKNTWEIFIDYINK